MLKKSISSRIFQSIKFSFKQHQSPCNFIQLSDKIKPKLKLTLQPCSTYHEIKFKLTNNFSSSKKDFNQRKDKHNLLKLNKYTSSQSRNPLFNQSLLQNHLLKIIESQIKESKPKNLLKLIFLIRNFLILALNLGPELSVMNQIEFGEQYKIKIGKKIMKAQFQLIKKLQIQFQKFYNQQNLTEQHQIKKLSIVVSQFYLLAKALQLVSNQQQFSVQKCFKSHHTWKQRFNNFKQCLPYGVLSKSFKEAEIYLLLVQDNFKKLYLDNNKKREIDYIFTNIMSLAENSEFLRSNQYLFDKEKVMKYFFEYREQHQKNFGKNNEQVLKEQISSQFANLSISGMSNETYLATNQQNKSEYLFHSRKRRLQVDFGFVEYGLALFYTKKYQKQQKVNILNKIKNKVHSQYEQYEETLRLAKENKQSEDKRNEKNVKHLVAYDFGEYMRSNKIYAWLIYRVEDQKH